MLHDFACKDAKDIYFPELAKGVKHFKEEGGRGIMCKAIEDYGKEMAIKAEIKAEVKAGIAYGIEKEVIISRLCKEFKLSLEEAEKQYNTYAAVAV